MLLLNIKTISSSRPKVHLILACFQNMQMYFKKTLEIFISTKAVVYTLLGIQNHHIDMK